MRHSGKPWLLFLTIALLILGLYRPLAIHAAEPIVRPSPAEIQISVGQTVDVPVVVSGISGLYGADLRLSFDPLLLEVTDANASLAGVQVQPGEFPYPDFVVKNEADDTAGTVWYAALQLNPREPASGTGAMLTLRLRAKAAGTTQVLISQSKLVDRDGTAIAHTVAAAQVAVGDAQSAPSATLAPTHAPTTSPLATATLVPTANPSATAQQAGPTATGILASSVVPSETPRAVHATSGATSLASEVPTKPLVSPPEQLSPTPARVQDTIAPTRPAESVAASQTPAPQPTSLSSATMLPTAAPSHTPALVAALVPTVAQAATPAPGKAVEKTVFSQRMLACLVVTLIIVIGLFASYAMTQRRKPG